MIGPIGVYHSYFRNGRIALFGISEIRLTKLYIVKIHSKTEFLNKSVQSLIIQTDKIFKYLHLFRYLIIGVKSPDSVKGRFSALNRVNKIRF